MSEIDATATRTGLFTYHLDWSDSTSTGPFYIYQNTDQIAVTTEQSIDLSIAPETHPVVQIFDSSTDLPDFYHSGNIELIWSNKNQIENWTVEQKIDDEWTKISEAGETNANGPQIRWLSPWLGDAVEIEYRVVPKNSENIDGEAIYFNIVTARVPDIPDFKFSAIYDSTTGDVEGWFINV